MARRKKLPGRRVSTTIRPYKTVSKSSPAHLRRLARELQEKQEQEKEQEKDKTMPTSNPKPTPPPYTTTTPTPAPAKPVSHPVLHVTEEVFESLVRRVEALEKIVSEHEDRLVPLEANLPKRDQRDTISSLIFDYLRRHQGVKFNTGSIAANIDQVTSDSASTLLRGLVNKYPKNVRFEKKTGYSAMFWYEDDSDSDSDSENGEF